MPEKANSKGNLKRGGYYGPGAERRMVNSESGSDSNGRGLNSVGLGGLNARLGPGANLNSEISRSESTKTSKQSQDQFSLSTVKGGVSEADNNSLPSLSPISLSPRSPRDEYGNRLSGGGGGNLKSKKGGASGGVGGNSSSAPQVGPQSETDDPAIMKARDALKGAPENSLEALTCILELTMAESKGMLANKGSDRKSPLSLHLPMLLDTLDNLKNFMRAQFGAESTFSNQLIESLDLKKKALETCSKEMVASQKQKNFKKGSGSAKESIMPIVTSGAILKYDKQMNRLPPNDPYDTAYPDGGAVRALNQIFHHMDFLVEVFSKLLTGSPKTSKDPLNNLLLECYDNSNLAKSQSWILRGTVRTALSVAPLPTRADLEGEMAARERMPVRELGKRMADSGKEMSDVVQAEFKKEGVEWVF